MLYLVLDKVFVFLSYYKLCGKDLNSFFLSFSSFFGGMLKIFLFTYIDKIRSILYFGEVYLVLQRYMNVFYYYEICVLIVDFLLLI